MRHGSLFSGIGGFDLAADWMGWENVFQVEKDSFCQKVLAKNFPGTVRYGDIKEFDGTKYRGAVDIISGGFPCQPFSVAGKRKGKADDRFLWPEMLRVIREVRPSFVVGENVTGIIGLALEQVLTEVEAQGYKAETFIITACALNAPHRRDRVWIVAINSECADDGRYFTGTRAGIRMEMDRNQLDASGWQQGTNNAEPSGTHVTNTRSYKLQRGTVRYKPTEGTQSIDEQSSGRDQFHGQNWQVFPTQPAVCRGNDGIPNRVDRIKALGNAIVPQVAYEIFKAIESVLSHDNKSTSPAVTLHSEVEKENTQVRNNQKLTK